MLKIYYCNIVCTINQLETKQVRNEIIVIIKIRAGVDYKKVDVK